jgi:hypothetical protein
VASARPHLPLLTSSSQPAIIAPYDMLNHVVVLTKLAQTGSPAFYLLSASFHIWMNFQKVISEYLSCHFIIGPLSIPL